MNKIRNRTGMRFVYPIGVKGMKFKGFHYPENPYRGAIFMQEGGMTSSQVDSILLANKDKNFVNRFINKGIFPNIPNLDGSVSTHEMQSTDNFSYPTIIQNNKGKLIDLKKIPYRPSAAYDNAMNTGQYIQFPTEQQAMWFSENGYKTGAKTGFKKGGVIVDPMGQYNHPGKETIIPTKDGRITMKNIPYPMIGIDETNDVQFMKPNGEYQFRGKRIHEIPLMQAGGRKINPNEAPTYLNNGYRDIGNNTLVKNQAQLKALQAAKGSNQQGGLEYEQWLKSELGKGRSISELVRMGYGNEQSLNVLAQGIKPVNDTVYYNIPNPTTGDFTKFSAGEFKSNPYVVKPGNNTDSVFFHPNVDKRIFQDPDLPYQLGASSALGENGRKIYIGTRGFSSVNDKSKPVVSNVSKMQQGGYSAKDLYSFLFDEDEEKQNTAPDDKEIEELQQQSFLQGQKESDRRYKKQLKRLNNDTLINSILQGVEEEGSLENYSQKPIPNSYVAPTNKQVDYSFTNKSLSGKSIAARHNNPGNLKFANWMSQFGATPGDPGLDGGRFAKFQDINSAMQARKYLLQNRGLYTNKTVDEAMKIYSNKGYDGSIYPEIRNKKMNQLNDSEFNELTRRQLIREDTKVARELGMMKVGGTYDIDDTMLEELKMKGYKYKII